MEKRTEEILAKACRIHFVGIGGSGMFPLVEILHNDGYIITGSDVIEGSIIDYERAMGIEVHIGHDAANAVGADAIVVTAALLAGNPEVAYAEEHDIPIIERAELLGWTTVHLGDSYCVSGTHGKTTTTCMLTSIFMEAGLDPSCVIGGKLPLIGGYGRRGSGSMMVVESCEFKDTFLHLSPTYPIILNVDADHLDYFGTLDGVKKSFRIFAGMAKDAVIANGDDANTLDTLSEIDKKVIYFGTGQNCNYRISDIKKGDKAFYSFTLTSPDGRSESYTLGVPGEHNVYNGAAAVTAAVIAGVEPDAIRRGFKSFHGAGRRFEILGEFDGISFADDYAHHPTELRATLDAAKEMGYSRVIAVFQPFTFSRTNLLLDDFGEALRKADITVLSDIMGSREINTIGITSGDLQKLIPGCTWLHTFPEICDKVLEIAKPGDLVITLGCGDIYKAANLMVNKCRK